ncbi:hypothetical protein F5877DRAFT_82296 [Lentinula edodes]|nr:hypothetical protein F5877DRAFT_82296 [Lentinula edodes]
MGSHSKSKRIYPRAENAGHSMVLRQRATALSLPRAASIATDRSNAPTHPAATHSMVLRRKTSLSKATVLTSNRRRAPTRLTAKMLQTQRERLGVLERKVVTLKEVLLSLDLELEEDISIRKIEYQCSICLDLAWSPYVCLSQCMAEHMRKRLVDPHGTEVIIRCPMCRQYIFRKPQRSLAIEDGVARVAAELQVTPPPPHALEWLY